MRIADSFLGTALLKKIINSQIKPIRPIKPVCSQKAKKRLCGWGTAHSK